MRILHCCLAAFYIDDFGYQENILPREHKRLGYQVEVLASTETYDEKLTLSYKNAGRYLSTDGYWVTRVSYVWWLPKFIARKFRIYQGHLSVIEKFKPDVLFMHDLQFLSIFRVLRYCKTNNVMVFVDSHTDSVNSGRGFLSKWLLHRVVYRLCAQAAERVAIRFWATLPLRASFLQSEYGVSADRIEVLPFGAEDSRLDWAARGIVRAETRRAWGILDSDFVFVFGGKIDRRKNCIELLRAFRALKAELGESRVHLVIFGRPVPAMKKEFEENLDCAGILHLEWLRSGDVHRVLWAADFALFPGTHSVLWEEAAGLGLPLAVRRWPGIEHLDVGGNCIFLDSGSVEEIKEIMSKVLINHELYKSMSMVATARATKVFSYSEIAVKAVTV